MDDPATAKPDSDLSVQRSALKVERSGEAGRVEHSAPAVFDLEERLLEFAVRVIRVTGSMKRTRAGIYVADQMLRSGTSPYGHHGEAEGAESRDDFVHKLRVCYKELREARRWLRLTQRTPLVAKPALLDGILKESDELVRIFAASIRTAEANRGNAQRRTFNAQRSSVRAGANKIPAKENP